MTVTDFPDFGDHQDQANLIAATGVPLLRNEQAVTSGTVGPLAAGASGNAAGGPFTLLAPSYDLTVTLTAAAGVANMNGVITLKWRDSTNTTLLAQKSFGVIASVGGHAVTVTGPVRGARLTITFTNSASSGANITFTYTLVQTARLAANDLCRTITAPGTTPPSLVTWSGANNADSGILGNAAPSIAAGSNAARGLNMYNGPVQLQANTASGTTDLTFTITVFDTSLAVNATNILQATSDSKGNVNLQFLLPMVQCFINLINHNAGAQNCTFLVTTAEPNVN